MSKVAGDQQGYSFCGAREYAIATGYPSSYAKVLSLDTSTNVLTLGLAGTTLSDVGDYTIEITVKLK